MARETDVMYIEWKFMPEPGEEEEGWVPEIEMLEEEFIRKVKAGEKIGREFLFRKLI